MASKQIRISIQSALNAAGITATKDQINKLGGTLEEFNRKQARVAKETGQSWAQLPGVFGKIQSSVEGVFAKALAVVGAFKTGCDIGEWINEKVIRPLFGIKDPIEELKRQNRELTAQAQAAAKAWEESFQKWTAAWESEVAGVDRVLRKVEQLSRSYLEMQKAKERVIAAGDNAELLKLERDKFTAMSTADSPEVAAAAGKKYDIQIAEATAQQKLEQYDRNMETAAQQLKTERERLAAAQQRGVALAQQLQGLEGKLKYWRSQQSVKDYDFDTSAKEEAKVGAELEKLRPKVEANKEEVKRRQDTIAAMRESAKAEAQERANLAESGRLEIDKRRKAYEDYIKETADAELVKERDEAKARIEQERKVAAERERLDAQEAVRRERARQDELAARIREHQRLLAEQRQAEGSANAGISAAESKLQQAWGWYRNKGSMAAQLEEEKADAEARKQFEKDFARLKDRRGRDWRKAENLSVDEEAVRRVALAKEERDAAVQYARETAENTAQLAEKLDELLQAK